MTIFFPFTCVKAEENTYRSSQALYLKTAALTDIPWYYLAAIDQYERNVRLSRQDLPDPKGLQGISIHPSIWSGPLNPNQQETDPRRIAFFGGIGRDGNGDGKADQANPEDTLYTMGSYMQKLGTTKPFIKISLWNYYHKDKAVALIMANARLYKHFGKIELKDHTFPIPKGYLADFRSTWGDRRGWGGIRIHEGTDIFASYGTPVLATSYGIIEFIGWNKYGGWRIGIRDPKNIYHYYAHLNGYHKGIKKGTIVKPGQIIGYVGSSGYGPKGTQGKFPPHLHYGMYKYNGKVEFSFDPYPYLNTWHRQQAIQR